MSKHTPGPWEWIGTNQLWGGERAMDEVLVAADNGKSYGLHSALIEHHWDAEQAIANRALIASAPDLLMALQMLYDETADYIRLNNLGGMDNQCMQLARAALAKAEGNENQS